MTTTELKINNREILKYARPPIRRLWKARRNKTGVKPTPHKSTEGLETKEDTLSLVVDILETIPSFEDFELQVSEVESWIKDIDAIKEHPEMERHIREFVLGQEEPLTEEDIRGVWESMETAREAAVAKA